MTFETWLEKEQNIDHKIYEIRSLKMQQELIKLYNEYNLKEWQKARKYKVC